MNEENPTKKRRPVWRRPGFYVPLGIFLLIVLAAVYIFVLPVTVSVSANLERPDLPKGEQVRFTVDGNEYQASSDAPQIQEISVPGYKRFDEVHVTAQSDYFHPVDTVIIPGMGQKHTVAIPLKRDDTFAHYGGFVYDAALDPIQDVSVKVGPMETTTDETGAFSVEIPLDQQKEFQDIEVSKPKYETIVEPQERPQIYLKYIMAGGEPKQYIPEEELEPGKFKKKKRK